MGFREDLAAARQDMAETKAGVTAVSGDVDRLYAKIMELENSPDRVSPADQAILTEIVAMASELKSSVKALDDRTAEPAPPTEEPPSEPAPG